MGQNHRCTIPREPSWIDHLLRKSISEIDPLSIQFNFWTHLHKRNIFIKKFHWDWFRFCMHFCSMKVQRPTAVYSSVYGISTTTITCSSRVKYFLTSNFVHVQLAVWLSFWFITFLSTWKAYSSHVSLFLQMAIYPSIFCLFAQIE